MQDVFCWLRLFANQSFTLLGDLPNLDERVNRPPKILPVASIGGYGEWLRTIIKYVILKMFNIRILIFCSDVINSAFHGMTCIVMIVTHNKK